MVVRLFLSCLSCSTSSRDDLFVSDCIGYQLHLRPYGVEHPQAGIIRIGYILDVK